MPSVTLHPVDDSYVADGAPTTNFSADTFLEVGSGQNGTARSWIKFDLSSLAGMTVTSVELHLLHYFNPFATYATQDYYVKRCTDNSWSEGAITWNNAPNKSVSGTISGQWTNVFDIAVHENISLTAAQLATDVGNAIASGYISWRIEASNGDGGEDLSADEYSQSPKYPYLLVTYTAATTIFIPPLINQPLLVGNNVIGY